jgi:transketolase
MNKTDISMRDALISEIYKSMLHNNDIFFISADFGALTLDKLRIEFPERFINVGIAEQNLINVATGLALEGHIVYAYAIAPFLTMRAYEQIRINLSLLSQHREINVNLIGVGGGASYDVAGPTHQCFEDISIIRTLPNIEMFSPSDWSLTQRFFEYSLITKTPKYLRLDGKVLPRLYHSDENISLQKGFHELARGNDICIVSTGYFTHKAIKVADTFHKSGSKIGIIDMFMLKPFNSNALKNVLVQYKFVITFEEAFIFKGGLDTIIMNLIHRENLDITLTTMGYKDTYIFESGNRDEISAFHSCSEKDLEMAVTACLNNK